MDNHNGTSPATRVISVGISAALVAVFIVGCARYSVPMNCKRPETPPPPDTARVFFINPGAPEGDTSTFILKETRLIGYLESRRAAFVDVPEGEHLFISAGRNMEGLFATLEGGRTYYLLLAFERGPETAVGTETVNAYWDPIVPGEDSWERRHEWLDRSQLVALNQDRARSWNTRWSERNEQWFEQFRRGEKKYMRLGPDQGE